MNALWRTRWCLMRWCRNRCASMVEWGLLCLLTNHHVMARFWEIVGQQQHNKAQSKNGRILVSVTRSLNRGARKRGADRNFAKMLWPIMRGQQHCNPNQRIAAFHSQPLNNHISRAGGMTCILVLIHRVALKGNTLAGFQRTCTVCTIQMNEG
jgi:hypothetical protein